MVVWGLERLSFGKIVWEMEEDGIEQWRVGRLFEMEKKALIWQKGIFEVVGKCVKICRL